MKKIIPFLFFIMKMTNLFSQKDSIVISPLIISGEIGIGPGFVIFDNHPVLPRGYDELVYYHNSYCDLKADFDFIWKEKFGIKLHGGRVGNNGSNFVFWRGYLKTAFPDYSTQEHYGFYNRAGYSYNYLTAEFSYCFKFWKLQLNPYAGLGVGNFEGAGFQLNMKENNSNNFFQMEYTSPKKMNWNYRAGFELGYFKEITPRWSITTGLSFDFISIFSNYQFTYTEQFYNQPQSVNETYSVKDDLNHFAIDAFLKFNWRTKASGMVFY